MTKFKGTVVCALVIALMLLCASALAQTYVEATASTNIRSEPSLSGELVSSMTKGTRLAYLGESDYDDRGVEWYLVETSKGDAWVSARYTKLIGATSASTDDDWYDEGDYTDEFDEGYDDDYVDETFDEDDESTYDADYYTGDVYTEDSWYYDAYVVTTASVNIRTGPGLDYRKLSTASEGSYFSYEGRRSYDDRGVAWYRIDCSKGIGWISSRYSVLVNDDPYYYDYVRSTASVNIRSGPGLGYDKISDTAKGRSFVYLNQTRYDWRGVAWYRISCSKGVGWISSRYSKLVYNS